MRSARNAHGHASYSQRCQTATLLLVITGLDPVIHVEVRPTLVRHVLLKLVPASWTLLWPSRTAYYAGSSMQSEFNGRMLEIIREMAGAAFITLPSSDADFGNPEIAADLERYMCSGSTDAKTRIKLMRLIWDFLGSEFGSRHSQYEKFYGGPSFAAKQNLYRNFDFKRATGLVDKALNLPAVE